ncbi:DoxX family protein [Kovacikia minuta CCNUW1]|uniref:DoxX family protein n=1 Tax=Kovacikia minuta TaxID=2931930 RepID=UPI001CCDEC7B|nr:DoxX family protein [Kovacikia minuta]UBF24230.1 DoxX family protein [Kovacikia minuta CCNUW1]
MQKWILLLARILLSAIFLKSGFDKITGYAATQQFMAAAGLPFAALLLPLTILIELLGGLSILLGYKARWGALVLFLFLIPTTLVFHTDFSQRIQVIQFMKNLAIMGGLLMLYGTEPGTVSLDEKLGSVKH